MLFSSITFLYYFLPSVLLVYFMIPQRFKNTWLLLASLFFYGWGEPKFLLVMLITMVQGYVFGLLIEKYHGSRRSKVFLTASVIMSLIILGYCKYADFFISGINAVSGLSLPAIKLALPIGISFYTFQMISYVADVYRGSAYAQKSFINLAAYIAMFPQLVAGPIVRYSDIGKQLENRIHSIDKAALGIRRFIIGLSKKILLANVLGEFITIFKTSGEKSVLFFWMYAAAYTLHIYFDFSGYSDMAIGLGKIMGFDFPENFNYPYISGSITEFWRRWHISLGRWFRDYVYIPLGGNRVSGLRWIRNILIVWFLTGLWHGAAWNFAVWGLLYALLLAAEKQRVLKQWLKKETICKHIYVMFFVMAGFIIFDASSLRDAFLYFQAMFGGCGYPFISFETIYYFKSYAGIFVLAIIGATPLVSWILQRIGSREKGRYFLNLLEPIILVLLLAVSTAYLVDGAFNPFLYFRF